MPEITYDPEARALYIDLVDTLDTRYSALRAGKHPVVIDFDGEGRIVGIEILNVDPEEAPGA